KLRIEQYIRQQQSILQQIPQIQGAGANMTITLTDEEELKFLSESMEDNNPKQAKQGQQQPNASKTSCASSIDLTTGQASPPNSEEGKTRPKTHSPPVSPTFTPPHQQRLLDAVKDVGQRM